MNDEASKQEQTEGRVKSILRDTHKKITYVFMASRKLKRNEMLVQLRDFHYNPNRDRPKSGDKVVIETDI